MSVFVPANTVILAVGMRPRKDAVEVKAAFPEAHVIGEAAGGRKIVDGPQAAYREAFVFESYLRG